MNKDRDYELGYLRLKNRTQLRMLRTIQAELQKLVHSPWILPEPFRTRVTDWLSEYDSWEYSSDGED